MDRDGADLIETDISLAQRLVNDGEKALEMGASGDLGNDAAEAGVQIGLRGDDIGENARLVGEDGGGGFVTRTFNGEEVHTLNQS